MAELVLDYRSNQNAQPHFLKHTEVEQLASVIRAQLLPEDAYAMPLATLASVDRLKVNGIGYELWIDTEHALTDEQDQSVLGLCEFDPGAPDAVMLSVSPANDSITEELVLSTFAHELGHALFDAPGWLYQAAQGPGLFDEPEISHKAYRTTTENAEHLAHHGVADPLIKPRPHEQAVYFAELRANEFMGSLLVPRHRLALGIMICAPKLNVPLVTTPELDSDCPGTLLRIADVSAEGLENLQRVLAKRFGVHRRFIEVRMSRYGFLPAR